MAKASSSARSLLPHDADELPLLGGQQHVALDEAAQQLPLDAPHQGVDVGEGLLARGDRDGVGAGQPQPEALRALGEPAEVAAAVEQVVDELAALGLLLPDREPLGALVALAERADGRLDRGQHGVAAAGALGGARGPGHAGQGGPGAAGLGEVFRDQLAQAAP